MSQRDQKDENLEYDLSLTDIPPLDEEFSLEEILAEYGTSREQKLMEDVEQEVRERNPELELPPLRTRDAVPASEALTPPVPQEEAAAEPPEPTPAVPPEMPPDLPEEIAQPFDIPEEAETTERPEDRKEAEEAPSLPEISLEAVVSSTVEAVMEEQAEPIVKPRRGLFSRRNLEDTEAFYGPPEPEPEPEPEPIGPEPDLSEAAMNYRNEYRGRKAGMIPAVLSGLLPTIPLLVEQYGVQIPMWSGDYHFQSMILLACLGVTALLCRQVFAKAFGMLRRGRIVSELLLFLAVLAAMGDCGACLAWPERTQTAPYGAAVCLAMVIAQWGVIRESRGMYETFRAAAMDREPPYLVTDVEEGACKQRGAVPGFYTITMKDNVSVLWQTALLPVVLVGSVVFACLSSWGQGREQDFLLNWSAILTAGATAALPLCWGIPFGRLAEHLQKIGCAVAGWAGAERVSRGKCMIVTDTDLFPPGTIQLNGVKLYGEERQKVLTYAATLVRCAGSGLERLFDRLLRGEMGRYENASEFAFCEEGGFSAVIRGETVLLGTASFMRKKCIRMPGDIKLKTGLYLAIDRQLAAVFAVKYQPAENVEFALRLMQNSHVLPILASRDPNITPTLLKRKFHKNLRVEYPDLSSRVALSETEKDQDLPRALLFREGLLPYAELVVGSRRMCQAVRQATALGLIGSVVGTLLMFYLVFRPAYELLTPLMLEVFLLLWVLPVLLIGNWSKKT